MVILKAGFYFILFWKKVLNIWWAERELCVGKFIFIERKIQPSNLHHNLPLAKNYTVLSVSTRGFKSEPGGTGVLARFSEIQRRHLRGVGQGALLTYNPTLALPTFTQNLSTFFRQRVLKYTRNAAKMSILAKIAEIENEVSFTGTAG